MVKMHIIYMGIYLITPNDAQSAVLDNLQTEWIMFAEESPCRGGIGHLRPNICFVK